MVENEGIASRVWMRCKRVLRFYMVRVPCFASIFPRICSARRNRYSTVTQLEDNSGGKVDDDRQQCGLVVGLWVLRFSVVYGIGATIVLTVRGTSVDLPTAPNKTDHVELFLLLFMVFTEFFFVRSLCSQYCNSLQASSICAPTSLRSRTHSTLL